MITHLRHTLCGQTADVELGPVTVMIGPNGSGKSVVLNAIQAAHRGRLDWPVDGKPAARTITDVVAALLPKNEKTASVDVEIDGQHINRRVSRTRSGKASIDLAYDGCAGKKAERALEVGVVIDPLAYSLAPWLEQTGPQRVAEMLNYAAVRDVTGDDLDCYSWAGDGAFLALEDSTIKGGPQHGAERAQHRVTELRRELQELERRIKADIDELGKLATPNRPRPEIEESLQTSRSRLAEVIGEIKASEAREVDYKQAAETIRKREIELREMQRRLEGADKASAEATRTLRRVEAAEYELIDVDRLQLEKDIAEDALSELEFSAGMAYHLQAVLDTELLCAACTEKLLRCVREDRGETDTVGDAGLAVTHAERKLREAAAFNRKTEQQQRDDHAAIEKARRDIGAVKDLQRQEAEARVRFLEAQGDAGRFRPGERFEQLQAERAGIEQAIKVDETDLEVHRSAGTLEGRTAEAKEQRGELEEKIEQWKAAGEDLLALRSRLLVEALAPLDQAADAIYHATVGGHLRFNAERGGVDITTPDGITRPLELASTGERAMAFPAVSSAMQRARGCDRPMLFLDGLESLDCRHELMDLCVDMVKSDHLHQVIANWTASPDVIVGDGDKQTPLLEVELGIARGIEGVTVIETAPREAQEVEA